MAHMARQLDWAGANALVLFNRFYQPDIDLENLEVTPNVLLSTRQAQRRGCAEDADGGGQRDDACLGFVAARHRPDAGGAAGVRQWMEEHEYESAEQMQGSMSHSSCANPTAFERANYIKALHTFEMK